MDYHLHQTFIFLSFFSLVFLNSGHAKCVPRNATTPSPTPHTPPELQPVSTPKPSQPATPTPSSSTPSKQPPAQPAPVSKPTPRQPFFKRPSFLPNSAQSAVSVNPAIKKICDSTDYPDLCMSSISPQMKGAADARAMLNIAIKVGLEFAKTALAEAEKLANKPGTSPNLASLFKDCKDSYDDAQYNFENAMAAGNDLGTTNTMLSAAITDVGDCEDAFQGKPCPLTTFSEKLTKLASNCLAIASLIH